MVIYIRDGHLTFNTKVAKEVIVTIVSKLAYNLFRGLTTEFFTGYNLSMHLLSTMDIPVRPFPATKKKGPF